MGVLLSNPQQDWETYSMISTAAELTCKVQKEFPSSGAKPKISAPERTSADAADLRSKSSTALPAQLS